MRKRCAGKADGVLGRDSALSVVLGRTIMPNQVSRSPKIQPDQTAQGRCQRPTCRLKERRSGSLVRLPAANACPQRAVGGPDVADGISRGDTLQAIDEALRGMTRTVGKKP